MTINKKSTTFLSLNLFVLFLFLVSVLILKNANSQYDCNTIDCSNVPLNKNSIFDIFNYLVKFLPYFSLIFSMLVIFSGNKNKILNRQANIFGLALVSVISVYFLGMSINRFSPAYMDLINYIFGITTICLATLWLLSYLYNINNRLSISKYSIYDIWVISSFILIAVGIYISSTNVSEQCIGFPICENLSSLTIGGVFVLVHRVSTAIVAIISVIVLNRTWLYYRSSLRMLISTTSAFALFWGQILIGGLQVTRNYPIDLVGIHSIATALFIVTLLVSVFSSKFELRSEKAERMTVFNDKQRRLDFFRLNKPIIVLLLLVTTYAGMVVGGGKIPGFGLTFWTIIAGALAAGGASAVNQFIDREIDQTMQRTSKRPIPSGRLQPAEALALGIVEIIFSFFIYASFVNLVAALLAMLGMFYYVFVYSMWLKHATVQNIVIGGGAGAIPPLVGWAAVTGSLNVPSLFLFALVFLWTPPHFWALAIVRKNDYARANVPMLPVIKGEKNTRTQILIYTSQLVLLTLIMPFFKLGGSIFLISAIILGGWLLYTAWQVFTINGNKIAFKMYRYSSMYLVFIFLALSIDALI